MTVSPSSNWSPGERQSFRIGDERRPKSCDAHVKLSSVSWKWKAVMIEKDRMLVWVVTHAGLSLELGLEQELEQQLEQELTDY